ncbi:MAG: hypothetical protein ACLR94_17095 [Acutalibacteraceae bacterium]
MGEKEIRVREGTERDFLQMLPLCDERYGPGYLTKAIFDRWMEHKSLLKIAEMGGEFAGFAVMVPASVEEVMEKMAMPREDVDAIAGGRPALIYKSAAVPRRHEHKGVMHALAVAGLATARQEGYGSLFGSAWMYNGKSPIAGTFQSFGFVPLYRREKLWYNDSGYTCVVCKGRCICDAMIYYKIL